MYINELSSSAASALSFSTAPSRASKLHNAAQQFESLVIGEMLRAQREAGSEGWLGSGDDPGSDSAMDIAESQLSNALAAGGGLGLAKVIEEKMGAQADSASVATGSLSKIPAL